MKKLFFIFLILSIFFLYSFYPPFTRLIKVETEHYIIYYEKHLQDLIDTEYIKFMEESYKFLSNLFNHQIKNKIYIYFSDREKYANGFNNPVGQSTIYIITTPPELLSSIGYMDDWLKLVFYHELTHQFSLTLKSKFAEFLSYIFGNIFLSSYFNNPFIMVEGVTTSFEGRDKEIGRTYSPYIKQFIMQSIIDGNFKNPYEIESSFNEYPYQSLGYWYGGFFSKFLQQTYGMQLYITLWQNTAILPFEKAIKKVYDKELPELWDEFYDWIKPKFEVYVNFEDLLKNSRKDILSNGRLVKTEENLFYYYYNINLKTIFRYDIQNKKSEPVIKNIMYFYSFEIDRNGKNLILSYYNYKGSSIVINNKIFDLEKKRFVKSVLDSFNEIREVNFFNDGYIAIDLSRSFTDLILIKADRSKKLIVKGSKNFYISSPKQLDSKTIVFLGSSNGERAIYSYDILEDKLEKLKINANYIYQINTFDNKIFFTYNDDFSLSKFGMINEDKEIHFDKNLSGGFTDPFYIDKKIIYLGSFSNKTLLLKIDIDLDSPSESQNLLLKNPNHDFVKLFSYNEKSNEIIDINKDLEISNNFIKNIDNQVDTKQENNTKSNTKNGDHKEDENILKKSFSIFFFNENLIPDFWMPSASFYFNQINFQYEFYFAGFGGGIFWLEPVTNSTTYFGTYISSLEPFKISFDFNSYINLFYPFLINLKAASYNLIPISTDAVSLEYIFLAGVDIFYIYFRPINQDKHILNPGIYYRYNGNFSFFSIYLGYDYYVNLFKNPYMTFYIKNIFYYSFIDLINKYSFKYELESRLSFKSFGIKIIDNLAMAKESTLSTYGANQYYHISFYEPFFELSSINSEISFNFCNMLNIKANIFETSQMGILNLIIPSSIFILSLDIGFKNYFIANLDYSSLDFNNVIIDNLYYISLSLTSAKDAVKFVFVTSYSINSNKLFYYFYYTILIPYSLFY